MDVVSLYTVIPHGEGLKALEHFFNTRNVQDPPTNTIIRLADFVLTQNAFELDKKFYTQKCGGAMGSSLSKSYACLFVGKVESDFFIHTLDPNPNCLSDSLIIVLDVPL